MEKEVTIRPYTVDDYSSVISIYKEGELFDEVTDGEEALRSKSKQDPESLLVAEQDGFVIGTISIVEDGRMALLFRLGVRESARNQGVGKKLMIEAERILKERGHKEANLVVNDQNIELHGFYERKGYKKHRLWRWMAKELT